ncbi:monovalent cation/H(+) antiporter subunit G [Planctobacterium marinum]|uniref:monovalent cation/H(+) antiporter subunit G n=1 Tax=Planctobacterium marinum TaxID=1631968 RepID=UPI001E4E03EE|nr:monovalent cation/H(+) antiporter subunit G [Planctobacterium marinum]MCC2604942.1 monovalent cation/H(+) antiporter subunit G [Planctobacterium marinum]
MTDNVLWIDILSGILVLSGSFFCFSGAVGLHRFPDFFTRMHAASVTDTLGAGLVLSGLMLQAGFSLVTLKLLFILLFLLITGPASSHAMAKAALHSGRKPLGEHIRIDIPAMSREDDSSGGVKSKP